MNLLLTTLTVGPMFWPPSSHSTRAQPVPTTNINVGIIQALQSRDPVGQRPRPCASSMPSCVNLTADPKSFYHVRGHQSKRSLQGPPRFQDGIHVCNNIVGFLPPLLNLLKQRVLQQGQSVLLLKRCGRRKNMAMPRGKNQHTLYEL